MQRQRQLAGSLSDSNVVERAADGSGGCSQAVHYKAATMLAERVQWAFQPTAGPTTGSLPSA